MRSRGRETSRETTLPSRENVPDGVDFMEGVLRLRRSKPIFVGLVTDEARVWVQQFVHWYNEEHCHGGLKYVTPGQRDRGQADSLLTNPTAVYEAARASKPERWAGPIRKWDLDNVVYLNPERQEAAPAKFPIAA